jgi:dTMP kinase
MNKDRGVFITFEGGEGVGKSTHILLLEWRLKAAGIEVLSLREPGGTRISEEIRAILLSNENAELDFVSELLLYEAARAQLITQIIEPALEQGVTVLCDRFTDSTLAYQGIARGLGLELVEQANLIGSKGLVPHRTIFLTHDPKEALSRATENGADRLEAEGLSFHAQVLAGFELLAERDPDRIRKVRSCSEKIDTALAVFEQVKDLFPQIAEADFQITPELLIEAKERHSR